MSEKDVRMRVISKIRKKERDVKKDKGGRGEKEEKRRKREEEK